MLQLKKKFAKNKMLNAFKESIKGVYTPLSSRTYRMPKDVRYPLKNCSKYQVCGINFYRMCVLIVQIERTRSYYSKENLIKKLFKIFK